jgi:hypothetical protein
VVLLNSGTAELYGYQYRPSCRIFGGFSVDHIFKIGFLLNLSLSSRYPQNRQGWQAANVTVTHHPQAHTVSAAVVVGGGGVVFKILIAILC